MMKKIIPLFTTLLLGWSMNAWFQLKFTLI